MNSITIKRLEKEYNMLIQDPPQTFLAYPLQVKYFKCRMICSPGILPWLDPKILSMKMDFFMGKLHYPFHILWNHQIFPF